MEDNFLELTSPQKNIWLSEKYNGNTTINSIVGTIEIKRNFNEKICADAVNYIIKSNDAMRFSFNEKQGVVTQQVNKYKEYNVNKYDLTGYSLNEIEEYKENLAEVPLDLSKNELYEFCLLKYSNDSGAIFMKVHHIISDAWSCSKIGTAMIKYIESKLKNENLQEADNPSYVDYIYSELEYKKSDKYLKDENFWQEYLNDFKDPLILKNISENISNEARRYNVVLTEKENESIINYCKDNRISPYVLFLTALSTYIYRIKSTSDFIIGTPVLNRSNFKEKNMVGMFVSTLPLRIKIEENIKFIDLAKSISTNTLSLFRHQKYPYSRTLEFVHKNTDIKSNLYSTVLSYQNARTDVVDENNYSTSWVFSKKISDQLQIHILDMDNTGRLNINYDYLTQIFDEVEIKYLHTRLMAIIFDAINNLDVDIENIHVMSKEEENKILYEFNDTDTDYPKDKTVIEIFEEQVEKTPDNIALVFEDKKITYKELNEKANQLAHYLREEKAINPNDVVGVMLERNSATIIAIIAILKAGGAYLPIDKEFPKDRIDYMLNNSESKLLLTNEKFKYENNIKVLLEKIECNKYSNSNLPKVNSINDLIYIIYTSGTTGNPKGVMVNHFNVTNLCFAANKFQNLEECTTWGNFSSYSFDISVLEIFIPLIFGKTVVIASEEQQKMPDKMSELISSKNIEVVYMTPTRMQLLINYDKNGLAISKLKRILLGGEVFPVNYYEILRNFTDARIYDGYGPTEITVWSSAKEIKSKDDINIGKPLANMQLYILDEKNRLLPIGCKGELCVGGNGVALGYYNNKEITDKKFINFNNKRIYKTGDISNFKFNGDLEYIGRKDNQIKLHGLRIEIEEIESVIKKFDVIEQASVKIIDDKICAYYYSNKKIEVEKLKKYLKEKLPSYMLPSFYMQVDKFEFNILGKVDKGKLPNISNNITRNIILAKNDTQKKLAKIISEVLKIKNIGINENVFELGIDSLELIKIITKIQEVFNIEIGIKDIYQNPTIEDIEKLINIKEEKVININDIEKRDSYPLTNSQIGIFANYSLNPNTLMYNIPFEIKFNKDIDVEKLRNAIFVAINSTDNFFIKLFIDKNGNVCQKIDRKMKYDIDIKEVSDDEYKKEKFNNIKSFDLLSDTLFDIKIFITKKYVFVIFNIHHIIFDGISINILLDKINSVYNNNKIKNNDICIGQFALLKKEINKTEKYEKSKKYFNNIFNEDLPNNNFVLDSARPKERSFKGDTINFRLDNELSNMIKEYSIKNNVTLNSLFLSALNVLLAKYMYSEDIIVGIATSGRKTIDEINEIGMFVKTMPFRTKLNYKENILDYIRAIQTKVIEYVDNDLYAYDELIRDLNIFRDYSRNALFDVMFVYQNTGIPKIKFGNSVAKINAIPTHTSKFDITFEIIPNNRRFDLNVEFSTDIFNKDRIEKIVEHYINVLKFMINNSNLTLYDIDIVSNTEKNVILDKFNNTFEKYPNNKTLIEIFEENVKKFPDKVAVCFEEKMLTYNELNIKANKLARFLIHRGIKENDVVSVMMDKSIEYLISIIAILKCGAIYISLTKELPDERMKYMMLNANTKMILTFGEYYRKIVELPVIHINEEYNDYINNEESNLNINRNSNDIVHIIYTSGTTGNPKGNMIINKGIIRLVLNTNYLDYSSDDVMLNSGSLTFDTSTFEIWGAMLNGMTLHMISKENILNPQYYKTYVNKNRITTTLIPTPIFNQLVEYDVSMFKNMKSIYVGGDVMLPKYANKVYSNCPKVKLYNVYGPAENTVICTANLIKRNYDSDISIGKVVSNNVCFVVDKCEKLCPIKVPGDLYVGGDGLALGYINMDELTSKKFTNVPFFKNKIYKTGDLTFWNTDGTISYISRIDSQLKIRGQRVEILEIQNKILEIEGIKEVVISVLEEKESKYLIAYYTSDFEIMSQDIIEYLKNYLPIYMIPYKFVRIKEMPLNQNGKIDRKKLPKIDLFENINIVLPKNKEQEKLLEIFKSVLNNNNIGITSNFFENGGDSVMVVKLVSEFFNNGYNIKYVDIFKYNTVLEIYNYLYKNTNKESISKNIDKYNYTNINKIISNNTIDNISKLKIKEKLGNVLLTGTTGFLGVHILDELIKNGVSKVYCLIREKNNEDISIRMKKQLEFFFEKNRADLIYSKIVLIKGDITNQKLFLSDDSELKNIVDDFDLVINCAACVKHYGDLNKFINVNVIGVKNIVDFCLKYNKELIQISTLSISGNILENGQVIQKNIIGTKNYLENDFYIGQDLDNVYVYTKYLAERCVLEAIAEKNLNAKVIRMGNLTGRYLDGKFQPNVQENAFSNRIKTLIKLGIIPRSLYELYIEMTPIDYASKAVVDIAKIKNSYNVFHIFNDNHAFMPFFMSTLKKIGFNIKIIEDNEVQRIINDYLKNSKKIVEIEGILSDIDKDGNLKYNSNIVIKSDFTKEILKKFNFTWPKLTEEYIEKYIQYLIDIKFLET